MKLDDPQNEPVFLDGPGDTLETRLRPQLIALFEKSGMEIALRTLISWATERWDRGRHHKDTTPWNISLVFQLLRSAQNLYEHRTHIEDIEF